MTKNEFLTALQDMLQTDTELAEDTPLAGMEEWDSLAFMVLIAFFDKNFGKKLTFEDLSACKTPAALMLLSGGAIQ
ncbi:MAG: acyl carrier protein [Desulfovibrio sp.]|nr:acyl carrier protein [Desulfovibrio sp.]